MRKSIYEETLDILDDILVDSFSDPQDEYNDCYMLNFKQIIKIEKAIKKAQKQEKLLEFYRQLVLDLGLVIEYDTTDDWNGPVDYEYLEINDNGLESLKTYKKIKELEKWQEN